MGVVDRVRNILVTPKTEWPRIAAEPATVKGIFTGYAMILALLPLVGMLLTALLSGFGLGLGFILVPAILTYFIGLAVLFVMALIADALAPGFDGRKDQLSAVKLVVYSATPQWVAGFLSFIPGIGWLLGLLGFAYAAYLLYLGSMPTMNVPESKAPAYTIVLILIWIVLSMFIVGAIISAVTLSMIGGMAMAGPYAG
jgi:hypothetical protein